jgi:uncharacterized protein with PQ loop repeat
MAGEPPRNGTCYGGGVSAEILGWVSSLILVITVGKQVYKQWKEGVGEGVSVWLFVGQVAASAGFVIYSVSVKNWVFVLTNALMLVNGAFGLVLVLRHNAQARRRDEGPTPRGAVAGAPARS